MFAILKAAGLNLLVQGGQLHWAFLLDTVYNTNFFVYFGTSS
jgi:hypothetical protein